MVTIDKEFCGIIQREMSIFVANSRPPRIRTIRQFCEQDFVIPKGRYKGRLWRPERQPWSGVLVDCFDTWPGNRFVGTGNVQSGKTIMMVILPALYHLFEIGEDVICGIPQLKMAGDKWDKEFMPVISASQKFLDMLPTKGPGSRGGGIGPDARITFQNGASLKFMSGQGRDEERSAYTARVLVVTEADRLDKSSDLSSEGTQLDQLEARVSSYEFDSRIYMECTVTTEDAFIWHTYSKSSTRSRLMCECPYCHEFICPEREDLIGYQDGKYKNATSAGIASHFYCRLCNHQFSKQDRFDMNQAMSLIHEGQTIQRVDGEVVVDGPIPETRTLGFRWNAFNNLFWSPEFIAEREWKAMYNSKDADADERVLRQWYWVLPCQPEEFELSPLEQDDIIAAQSKEHERGIVPYGTNWISMGVDLRGTELHYVTEAWNGSIGVIIDPGIIPIEREKYGLRQAILVALRTLRDRRVMTGYLLPNGDKMLPKVVVIDGGWKTVVVRSFIRECKKLRNNRFYISFGRGQSRPRGEAGAYNHPEKLSPGNILYIGENFYVKHNKKYQLPAIFVNSDEWKSNVHEGFETPDGNDGQLQLFSAVTADEHKLISEYAKQVAAEKPVRREVEGRGYVTVWTNKTKRPNHYLDATCLAHVGGYLCGVRVVSDDPVIQQQSQQQSPGRRSENRDEWEGSISLLTERE